MLRGPSPFMEKIRDLAEANDIPWLKWRYRCSQLHGDSVSPHLTADAEVWINEGVEYFSTINCPIGEGIQILSDLYPALNISFSHSLL